MTESSSTENAGRAARRDVFASARHYLQGRRGLLILGGVIAGAGLALSWSWLEALGVASVLLTLLPCAAMCALGLCMNRVGGRSCSTSTPVTRSLASNDDRPPPVVNEKPDSQQERRLTDA